MSKRTTQTEVLRRVGTFSDDPKLQAVLSKFEANVHEAVRAQHLDKAPLPQATPIARNNVRATFGQVVLFDPSATGLIIDLPKVSQTDHGHSVRLKNTTTSITAATVRAAPGQLIDGSATASISGARTAYHLYTDGEGWHFL